MKIGVFGTLTDSGIRIDELARAVEERGFESLWVGEHSHVPVAVASHPREGAKPLPDFYRRLPDAFVQLGAAAAVTEKIRLGTSVCIVPEHDPIWLAKQVATADYLSDGRFVFGVGYGWNELEMKHHGVDVRKKRSIFREKLGAMRQLWENDVAAYHGDHVVFEDSYCWPKPLQPRLPVLVGAEVGPMTADDIVNLSEGWLPMAFRGGEDRLPKQLALIRKVADEAGRSMSSIDVTLMDPFLAFTDYTPEQFQAGLQDCVGKKVVEDYELSGLVVGIPFFDRDRALQHLDTAAAHYFS